MLKIYLDLDAHYAKTLVLHPYCRNSLCIEPIIDYIGNLLAAARTGTVMAGPGRAPIMQKSGADDAIQAATDGCRKCVDGAVARVQHRTG